MKAKHGLRFLILLLLSVPSLTAGNIVAVAHTPYMTQTERLTLPDGEQGEIRLLHGDGILFSDSVRLLVLDGRGRPLARSGKYSLISLICDGTPRSCRGYVHDTAGVLTIDPSSFRSADTTLPSASVEGDDFMWSMESGNESWGFAARMASPSEIVFRESAFIMEHPYLHGSVMGLGCLTAVLAFVGTWRPTHRSRWLHTLWAFSILLRAMTAALVLYLIFALFVVIPLSLVSTLLSFTVGIAIVLGIRKHWGRSALIVPVSSVPP
ncbi:MULTISPECIES: hypothetical protein [unclassified Methylobacterium]|uniref:hypothetical protein n=1 Tax=unclassified Methylobacterium TaxID=2615210 RepID=UPI000701C618|nr:MULTISPECIES: hypothetical protein [unclassified Methylobacterium]KQO60554.1 hypothetical protein ASF24_00780 [Methylobacterium sp. Leaf86]KQO86353.1 hypothetical protein ASF32_07480 [Methylobacterium sp. Leaf91]